MGAISSLSQSLSVRCAGIQLKRTLVSTALVWAQQRESVLSARYYVCTVNMSYMHVTQCTLLSKSVYALVIAASILSIDAQICYVSADYFSCV